jgi:hypothetical protein
MHRGGEGKILEYRVVHGVVTADAVVGRATEQHELRSSLFTRSGGNMRSSVIAAGGCTTASHQ